MVARIFGPLTGLPMSDASFIPDMPIASEETWRRLVDGVLKGADFDKKLVSQTYDALRIAPLYAKSEGLTQVSGRAPGAPWSIIQRVDHPDAGEANRQALLDLENGATGLNLVFASAPAAHGFGLDGAPETLSATLAKVLDGIFLDAGVDIAVDGGAQNRDIGLALQAYVLQQGLDPKKTHIRFGLDPIGGFAATGSMRRDWGEKVPRFAMAVRDRLDHGFNAPVLAADARIIHAAGGSEAQELGYALASAVAYLRALEASGLPLDQARAIIEFRLAADADQFLTIAKFRAIRRLWARVEETSGLAPRPAFVAAETAWRMMTRRDPWVNLLRQTVAVFSAGVAGADAITVLPFTQALGLPDAFARRIARNTQTVLIEEANLARVADPAAGSGAFETLTDELCHAAWALFQEIEREGGIIAALHSGSLKARIAATRASRDKAIARRKDQMTGTSEFPDIREKPVAVLKSSPARLASLGGLDPYRLAEPFEALRDRAEGAGQPPVFLANLGAVADFTARAMFAKNAFEAGGLAAISNDGFASRDALVAAFKQSGARIACLCATDAIYAHDAVETARALKAAGARSIWLAGRPGELEQALTEAGVEGFLYAGCDLLAVLKQAHATLGLA
jgi:methylmalonyl-CoA mutase